MYLIQATNFRLNSCSEPFLLIADQPVYGYPPKLIDLCFLLYI